MSGRLGQNVQLGRLTCKNASVVDVILSHSLFHSVVEFKIEDFNGMFSDCHSHLKMSFSTHKPSKG